MYVIMKSVSTLITYIKKNEATQSDSLIVFLTVLDNLFQLLNLTSENLVRIHHIAHRLA